MEDLQSAFLAKSLRRDPDPTDKTKVRVRVTTCGTGFLWAGQVIGIEDLKETSFHERYPVRFGVWTGVMFLEHASALQKLIAKRATKDGAYIAALRDLHLHLAELQAVSKADGFGKDEEFDPARSLRAITRAFSSGEVTGRTQRPYRPSWSASYFAANGVDFFPLVSLEAVGEVDDEGELLPAKTKASPKVA